MLSSPLLRGLCLCSIISFFVKEPWVCWGLAPQEPLLNRRQAFASSAALVSAGKLSGGGGLWIPPSAAAATAGVITPVTTLSDGSSFPLASFGLQIYNDDTAYKLTLTAIEAGYRNFFASVLAGNQKGFAKAVRDSGISRQDLYICGSVVSNRAAGYEAAKRATTVGWKQNMDAFGVGNIDYLDQIMLDYPGPDKDSIQG